MRNWFYESGSPIVVPRWVIVVTWPEGDREYVALGTRTAFFRSKAEADRVVAGFAEGMDGHGKMDSVELSVDEARRIVSLEQTLVRGATGPE